MPQFLILDGALLENQLIQGEKLNAQCRSFYRGATDPEIEAVGPYIFTYPNSTSFQNWYIQNGLHKHWGILIDSPSSFDQIYEHFRKFVCFQSEDDQLLYFRFYDPRVLKLFLLDCDSVQLTEFFGPVTKFICEGENEDYVSIFSVDRGKLITEKVPANRVFLLCADELPDEKAHGSASSILPADQSGFPEQPLLYACLETDTEEFKKYMFSLSSDELSRYFTNVEHYYGRGLADNWIIFSISGMEDCLKMEEVSDETMQIRLYEAEKRIEANQKAYTDSILKSRKKQDENPASDAGPKKSKTWSWLKI